MNQMMKKVQEMQENMRRTEEEINAMEIQGESGGGLVKTTLNGKKECLRVSIDNNFALDDREMLEDLIAASITDASHKVDKIREEKLQSVTSGLNIPGGLGSLGNLLK